MKQYQYKVPLAVSVLALLFIVMLTVGLCGLSFADKGPIGLANLQQIDKLPYIYTGVRSMGCSSHDRSQNELGDAGHFLYQQGSEYVMMDAVGAGCVYRVWVTGINATDHIKFYLDGSSTAQIDKTVTDFFGGATAPFLTPLVGDRLVSSGGYYCYLPIPYTTGCKITFSNANAYYNIAYQQFADSVGASTWTGSEDSSAVRSQWNNIGNDPKGVADARTRTGSTAVTNGSTVTLLDETTPGEFSRIKISIPRLDTYDSVSNAILWNSRIKIYWDNEVNPRVDAPLGPFFGSYTPGATVRSLLVGTTTPSQFYCYYPMPFGTRATVKIYNGSGYDIPSLTYDIGEVDMSNVATMLSNRQIGYFAATWNAASLTYGIDFPCGNFTGQGVAAGLTINMAGTAQGNRGYLEGDERVYYDGSLTPQIYGTGTEDIFNGGYYFDQGIFNKPIHGNPSYLTAPVDTTICYRHFLGDRTQFKNGYLFGLEHGGYDDQYGTYSCVFFNYQAGAATAVQTDTIDVGNTTSETAHSYTIAGQQWSGTLVQYYEGDNDGQYLSDDGRTHNNYSQFVAAVSPSNGGVILRRRMDYSGVSQKAAVYVDNSLVGYWYDGGSNPSLYFRDSEFNIPASFTAGKSSITVKIVYTSGANWSEYYYWVFSLTDTSTTPGTVSGNVKNASLQNLVGANVSLSPGGANANTDASGNYSIPGVTAGSYNATASKAGYTSSTSGVTVTSGQVTTANFTLNPAPVGSITGWVKDISNNAISGATVQTTTGGYSTTTAADGTYTLSNVNTGTYSVTASKAGYLSLTNSGVVVTTGNSTPSNFNLNAGFNENFEVMPSWSSSFDAAWGSAATWSIVTGGQSGNQLQVSRAANGSSVKALVYTVPTNTNVTISTYEKCPSYGGGSYWIEHAYKLGNNTAQDFDANAGTWTQIQKFADTGTNGNGNVWTQYTATVNSGANTQITVGFKHGASGCVGPVVGWDNMVVSIGACTVPTITTQPQNSTVCAGTGASFSVTATNATSYQWKKAGSNISGATNSSYSIASTVAGDAGSYTVAVTNSCGTVTSNAATLTVNPLPAITTQPQSQTKNVGQSVTFSVTATNTTGYQWKKNGTNITGATASSYTIGSVVVGDAGNYTVVVSNSCGSVTSSTATLTVNGGGIASEAYETMPTWTSTFDAAWGSAATWSIVSGGQTANFLQASRTSNGSSEKVKVYAVPASTNITISIYLKCPSYGGGSYWVETSYKLGSNTAQDFDTNAGTWTPIKNFSNTGTNGNGGVWTQYTATLNTGANTQISIGFKHGATSCVGPVMGWDTLSIY